MSKKSGGAALNRLAGKKIVFEGKYGYANYELKRWVSLAEAQEGKVVDELTASIDYLVVPDLTQGKTAQKKAVSFNAKGATIQVIDSAAFQTMAMPTSDEWLALIRGGTQSKETLEKLAEFGSYLWYASGGSSKSLVTFTSESFDGIDLSGLDLSLIGFHHCSFVGTTLNNTEFDVATESDFSKAKGTRTKFTNADGGRFIGAVLENAQFGTFADADFTGATLKDAEFENDRYSLVYKRSAPAAAVNFSKAVLHGAKLQGVSLKAPLFDGAELQGAFLSGCTFTSAGFRGAKLDRALMLRCKMTDADFTNASLRGVNAVGADFSNSRFDGAEMEGSNLRMANLGGAALSKAKHYDPSAGNGGAVGPALTELDGIAKKARRLSVRFRMEGFKENEDTCNIDSSHFQYGWGGRLPGGVSGVAAAGRTGRIDFSDALMEVAAVAAGHKIRFETLEVSSTKSPKSGAELRELVIKGISEAFAQSPPAAEELASAVKAYTAKDRKKNAAARTAREEEKKKAEKVKAAETKKIEKKIEKAVGGKVNDVATFLKALELRIEEPKIKKATSMLKASGFKLFNDVTATHVNGVVKSQTDPDLVYACRIEQDGKYACCTQNLNVCGGLRGSICKHLLVLIIGLVQANELDPSTIDGWVAKSRTTKPELNKETMGEIFIRYKGAEAGEVDWRPTETVPEDYYAL